MSELINMDKDRINFRWQLLVTASAIALLAFAAGPTQAADGDNESPQLWIELGGQLSRQDQAQQSFSPIFPNSPQRPAIFSSSQKFEKLPSNSIDGTGKLSFQPEGSEWVFSASVRYGRANSKKDFHQQTFPQSVDAPFAYSGGLYHQTLHFAPNAAKFADTHVRTSESHTVLDFQAGKDVGLGLFGKDAASTFNVGVRYAQFNNKSNISLKSNPDWHFSYKYFTNAYSTPTRIRLVGAQPYHSNAANLTATRSFHGIGPTISWNGSSPLIGNVKNGELALDWGLNAAVLFGRQKAKTHHQTTGRYTEGTVGYGHAPDRPITFQGPTTPNHSRSHAVAIPNVGGLAGLSYRIENFKVSAGYRADFFFGAMDSGIDTTRKENVGFFGPFANVSIGIGE